MSQADLLGTAAGRAGTGQPTAADQVTALYRTHGMDLVRIAAVMLGSRAAAEDAVHDAFCGLFLRWDRLAEPQNARAYVRSAVMNWCRSELRRQIRPGRRADRTHRRLDLSGDPMPGRSA